MKPEVSIYPLDHKEFFSRVQSSPFKSLLCLWIIHNNTYLEKLEVDTTITKEIIYEERYPSFSYMLALSLNANYLFWFS